MSAPVTAKPSLQSAKGKDLGFANASKLELRGGRVSMPSATAKQRIMEILAPLGVPDDIAQEVTKHLVDASLSGV